MLESSCPVYRVLLLSALCMLHIFLKVTGCLPKALLSSLRLQFLQEYNSSSDLLCTFEFMFLPRCVQYINQHRPKCPFLLHEMMLILFIWAIHHHLDGHLLQRWPWLASLSPLRGMCQDTLGKHGWVLFCSVGFLPSSPSTLFAPPLKEKKIQGYE